MVADACLMAIICSFACHMLTEVFTGADTSTVALVVGCDGTHVVAMCS